MPMRIDRLLHGRPRILREFLTMRSTASRHEQRRARASSGYKEMDVILPDSAIIGSREVVGHGLNGQAHYLDLSEFPFPAIRYRECTPELMALREKERGDWRNLTVDEKKCLYRASFRQTFSEFDAPTILMWKRIVGSILGAFGICFLYMWFYNHYVANDFPESFSIESRIEQYYRQVRLNIAPFSGIRPPPGAQRRLHPKNKELLEVIQKQEAELEKNEEAD